MRSIRVDYILFALVASTDGLALVGCSNSPETNNSALPTATGGSATASGVGASTSNGGASAQGGATVQGGSGGSATNSNGGSGNAATSTSSSVGGQSTGGSKAQGGTSNQGGSATATGGASNNGGATNAGGKSAGGASNAGGAASGGASVGGKSAGGTSAGGTSAGGTSAGGTSAGGTGIGGASSTGGASVGGTSTGGSTTGTGGGSSGTWKGAVCTTMGTTAIATAFKTGYDAWKTAHVVECGSNLARVKGCQGDNSTCSEGMGYGMLLAVAAGDQAIFDKFNAFRKGLQAVNNAPDSTSGKLMAWLSGDTCPPAASGGNVNSATDGDLDAAMALVQADQRWPGGAYLTEAKQYIEAIWLNQVEKDGSGNPTRLKAGNLPLAQDTRDYVSYYAPGYFHVFASITGAAKWSKLADVFYTKLAEQQSKCSNGQVPDTFGATDCKIWYDSCRAPWRIATDYGWFGEERAKAFLDKLRSGSVSTSDPGAASDQKNSAIIGAFAMSGVSSDDATMQKMCNSWETTNRDDGPYFQKTLRLLFMTVAAGTPQSCVAP